MIIDDDIDYRLAISEMLVDQGYSVTTAKDGEMGLNSLIHDRDLPDLILVDLMMPIKGGLEFRREQSQLDEINKIPVVFVTGAVTLMENFACKNHLWKMKFLEW